MSGLPRFLLATGSAVVGVLLFTAIARPAFAEETAFWVHRPVTATGARAPHRTDVEKPTRRPELRRAELRRPETRRPDTRRPDTLKTAALNTSTRGTLPTPSTERGPLPTPSLAEQLQTGQSTPWAIVVGLTLLSLLPAILLAMTPLVRLLVVFHFLRQALGTQTAPSNQVLMGLGLMMTWFLMQPVLTQVEQQAIAPYRAGQMDGATALERGSEPVRRFMLQYARDKDLELFSSADGEPRLQSRMDAPMRVVVPAYMLSELKSGFQIGAVLFLPFLLMDLVVASVTTAVGMVQLPPVVISTPVKILLFVMVDGWHLLVSSLLKSFH